MKTDNHIISLKHIAIPLALLIILVPMISAPSLSAAADTEPEQKAPKHQQKKRICAADWVKAWQTAKQACPQATAITVYFKERTGPRIDSIKVFECIDLKAAGELLVLIIKPEDKSEELVEIIRPDDLSRIEVTRRK